MLETLLTFIAMPLGSSSPIPPGRATTADEVLDRFIEVTGGSPAYEALDNLVAEGVYTGSHLRFYGVDELPFRTVIAADGRWKRTWTSSGITETMVATEGWLFYPGRGVVPMDALQHALLVRELPRAQADWRDHWASVELARPDELDGAPTHVVTLSNGDADVLAERHFSQESGLLLLSRARSGTREIEVRYSDYRDVAGGVKIPHRVTVDSGPEDHHVYTRRSFRMTDTVDAEQFKKPAG